MKKRAFTLIELLIVVVVFSIIMASVLAVYISSQRAKYRIDRMTEAQQSARTALDFMIKDIRAAGYNIDLDEDATSNPQRRIVYASPYELIFNANIKPVNDNPENPIAPQAMDHTGITPFHYNPSKKFETGAETIIYTLDYDNTDGIINATDRGASESAFTPNPDDYALVKRVYGFDAATTSNGGANQIVSIVGGPDRFPSQTSGTPLFSYWYDNDGDPLTPNLLWGDNIVTDGVLSQAEANNLTAITNQDILDNIKIITVNITGVSRQQYKGEYYETNIQTDVSVTRNTSIDVSNVISHVYLDGGNGDFEMGEPGIPNFKVRLNTGEMAITDANGLWSFALIPGSYSASCSPVVGFSATTDLYFDFDVNDIDINLIIDANLKKFFGFRVTPTATIIGFAFVDSNGNEKWDATEEWLPDVTISTYNSSAITLGGDPNDPTYGTYNLTINANESLYVWVNAPIGYSPSGMDTGFAAWGFFSDITNYFELFPEGTSFGIDINSNLIKYVALGLVEATGNPPDIEVLEPNGGEIFLIGEVNDIKIKVYDFEDTLLIDELNFYYSVDAGDNWTYIGKSVTPSINDADSTYIYTWTPDSLITGSTICLIKVSVTDSDNWTIYDQSDDYFTIVGQEGYKSLYFTIEKVDSIYDEAMFIISKGISSDSALPYYCSTINSYVTGIVADSFESNNITTTAGTQFYNQNSEYAEYVTKKMIPYADTIYPGKWEFLLMGFVNDDETNFKYYEIEVYKRDSLGTLPSETLLFSTMDASTYNAGTLYHSPLGNAEAVDTILVTTNAFSMDRSNRLYFKLFWSGSYNTKKAYKNIQFHFGGESKSIVKLPSKP